MFKISELTKITYGQLVCGKSNILVKGVSIDSRTIKGGDLFIAIKGTHFDGHDFLGQALKRGAAAIIIDKLSVAAAKSTKAPIIKVKNTIKALADIAAHHRKRFNIPVIGITGSNGKTTTKDMVAWILERKFKVLKNPGTQNNHIGLPMALLKLNKRFDVVVLEMGTNHFGEISYLVKIAKPNMGIITNIQAAHLEFLKNLQGVYKEKSSLINNLSAPSVAILNMDDRLLRRNSTDKDKFVVGFGINNKTDYKASKIKTIGKNSTEFLVNSRRIIKLESIGLSNVYNALAGISVARLLGIDYNIIASRLKDFRFPDARFNFIKSNKVNFIDDTYNSNPTSLKQALDTLDKLRIAGRKIFIMGDMLELGSRREDFHRLAGKEIARVCDVLITVGNLTRLTAREARKSGLKAKSIFNCDSSKGARALLLKRISPDKNDIVLVKGSRLMRMEEVIR